MTDPTRRRLLRAALWPAANLVTPRALLPILGAAGASLAACASDTAEPEPDLIHDERVARLLAQATTVDMHSHAGRVIPGRYGASFDRPFEPLRRPMIRGGMNVVCLAVVSDTDFTRRGPDNVIHAWREPQAGDLYAWSERAFGRAQELLARERLPQILDRRGMSEARVAPASIVLASEGADFLEGRADRVDEYYERFGLRHMQLTHYRVSNIGDIQTEAPVNGGLTDFGVEVVRRCNARGIVVDVAHGTLDLVKRAAAVSTRPLILSHTSFEARPGARSRTIGAEHARVVADTGGVIGVWPPLHRFPTFAALADGMAAMVDAAGIDHVGIGTDMMGLTGPSRFDSYTDLPALLSALFDHGFNESEVAKLAGANYVRVFQETMTA